MLAGGEGSRVSEITKEAIPKALIQVQGKPFLDYKIDSLIKTGFTELTFLLGKFSDQIVDHIQGNVYPDIKIDYVNEHTPLGTGGAIQAALGRLPNTFWVTYADSLVFPKNTDLALIDKIVSVEESIMSVIPGNEEWGRSNVELNSDRITFYSRDQNDSAGRNLLWIEYGLIRISKSVFQNFLFETRFDFAEVIQSQILENKMHPLICEERFREVGNVKSFYETESWLKSQPHYYP